MGTLRYRPRRLARLIVRQILLTAVLSVGIGLWLHFNLVKYLIAIVVCQIAGIAGLWVETERRVRNTPLATQERTMRFDDDHVNVHSNGVDVRLEWKAFSGFAEWRSGYLLLLAKADSFFWIPKAAFDSPSKEATWHELVGSKI